MEIRHATPDDYAPIIKVINDWWGGRQMSDMLPKLFFVHFQSTSFIATENDQIAGFLIGFLSQTFPNEAYIHFVGVHPDFRKKGVGKMLYERFFEAIRQHDRHIVRCVTSPINRTSIAFHTRMGFVAEPGTLVSESGVPASPNYDGAGEHRVRFVKEI
ncbi:MAG: GNAT family N-acetyltransferase [Chloroflexi bacterium]|nr:GNAT family N-acetyltransferase [Chloroflexota bacterium]